MLATKLKQVGAALAALVTLAPAAAAQDAPDPSQFYIQNITYAGTGCPQGSAFVNIAPDGKAFTVAFDSFVVDHSNAPNQRAEMWRGCQLNMTTKVPDGWTFRLKTVDVRGYANLTPGARGHVSSWYQFTRIVDPWSIMIDQSIAGPFNDDYHMRSNQHPSAPWFPCEAQIRTDNPLKIWNRVYSYGVGMVTTDSIDGTVGFDYAIEWKRCGPPRQNGWGLCSQNGFMRNGQCWYESAVGQSCTAACSTRGGVSLGALPETKAVCEPFSMTLIDGNYGGVRACPAAGMGCAAQNYSFAMGCSDPSVTANAAAPGWNRFCPCNR